MSSVEKWEVVGKKGANPEKQTGKESKKKSEKIIKNPVKSNGVIEESKTMFGALLEVESKRDSLLLQQLNSHPSKLTITNRSHLPIQHALSNVDVEEVERLYAKQKQLFPSEKEKWFRNITNLFNNSFANITFDQAKYDRDFPLNCVSSQVERLFVEIISEYSDEYLKNFIFELIELMYQAQLKDLTYIGYQVVIQILLKKKPAIVMKNIDQFEGLMQRSSKVAGRGLCVLWTIAQAAKHSIKDALIVWTRVMLGYMTVKAYSSVVISFIYHTLNSTKWRLEDGFGIILKADYFKILSEVFAKSPALPPSLHQQLSNIYPQIKTLAWGERSENLHNFFIGYLNRCTSDGSPHKMQENLNCLVECLECDLKSYDRWTEDFQKHVSQSRLLLEHLEKVGVDSMDASLLRRVLLSIIKRDLPPPTTNPDLHACADISKRLLSSTGSGRLSWITLAIRISFLLSVITILAAAVLSYPHLCCILRTYFGLSDEWLEIVKKFQANIQNIFKWILERMEWIREVEWVAGVISWSREKLVVGESLGRDMLERVGKGTLLVGDWVAEKLMWVGEAGQRIASQLSAKVQPTLELVNQHMMTWLPVVLASVGHLVTACMHVFDECMHAIHHLVSMAAAWLSHNVPFFSLKEMLS